MYFHLNCLVFLFTFFHFTWQVQFMDVVFFQYVCVFFGGSYLLGFWELESFIELGSLNE
jgi:hypothetical protein